MVRKTAMIQDEQTLEQLENTFPSLSGDAFSAAFKRTIESGMDVLIAEDGYIYKVFPDGRREKIKKIDPPYSVEQGKPIQIR